MGDMKTPDFDDLLAAFDIPDIDANEAIHSGPEENEGPGGQGKPEPSVGGDSKDREEAAAAENDPESPAEASDHGLPQPPDTSTVSVIVKAPSCKPLKEEDEGTVDKSPPRSPQSPSSGAEAADEDSNDSPTSSSSSRPLKVRIKTIKTSCGNITRTVTRVPSEPDPPAPLAEGAFLAETSFLKLSPVTPTPEGPKVVSVQLGDGTRLKGTVLPVATIQNASTAMLMAASVARKAVVLPGGNATSPKTMTKSVLGLVPQTLPKAEVRTGFSLGGQKVNGASVVMVQPSKSATGPGTAGGSVISRTQSSLVEAFNKILNSKNLLPAYRPNLSPPAEAGLALPPTGYRCLECGDAFSLEKSLARHYDRRSMRIEVTCNHCARRLVFFNKCSLLLHAREHKDLLVNKI